MPLNPGTRAQIIRLARSGALERAWSFLEKIEPATASGDPVALTLRARLEKDRAKLASGSTRIRWFERSAENYLRAAEVGGGSYSLINAATLSLMAGRRQQAAQLAQQVLDQLEANPEEAETRYWLGATRAEALLLLGKLPEARAALRAAAAEAPLAWEDRAATIGQFALICEELDCDASWLDRFRPPRSVQFTGIMDIGQSEPAVETRIAERLEAENVGFGFGALAAGADIWIAEALVERGAVLNVLLPCPIEVFREKSVASVDPSWLPRFDRLIEAADTIDELDTATAPSPAAVRLADSVALGLAIHNARILQSEPLRLRITDKREVREDAGAGELREILLAASRRPASRDLRIGEAGMAKALLRVGRAAGDGVRAAAFFGSPREAWAAAQPLVRAGKPVALDYRFVDDGSADDDVVPRLDAIADVVEDGQALASKAMAFALLAETAGLRIETMGEVRGAGGFFPVFAIS